VEEWLDIKVENCVFWENAFLEMQEIMKNTSNMFPHFPNSIHNINLFYS
jgi:hypothetical protein